MRAFDLGGRDAYIHFSHWCDDLERRMLADWIEETAGDGVAWLEVREAAIQGWQERQDSQACAVEIDDDDSDFERDSLLLRAQLFGADLGLEFPLGSMELVVGGTLGAVRYSQHTESTGATTSGSESASAVEFVAAPMAILHIRIGPIMVAPQVVYYFAGVPDLRWSVGGSGPALSFSVLLPIETDRIRY